MHRRDTAQVTPDATPGSSVPVSSAQSPLATEEPQAEVLPDRAASPTTGQVQANGITLAYESFGSTDNEAILLIGAIAQLSAIPFNLCDQSHDQPLCKIYPYFA